MSVRWGGLAAVLVALFLVAYVSGWYEWHSPESDPNGHLHVIGLTVVADENTYNGTPGWPSHAAVIRAERLIPLPLPAPRAQPNCKATHRMLGVTVTLSDSTITQYVNCRTPVSFARALNALKPPTGWGE